MTKIIWWARLVRVIDGVRRVGYREVSGPDDPQLEPGDTVQAYETERWPNSKMWYMLRQGYSVVGPPGTGDSLFERGGYYKDEQRREGPKVALQRVVGG